MQGLHFPVKVSPKSERRAYWKSDERGSLLFGSGFGLGASAV